MFGRHAVLDNASESIIVAFVLELFRVSKAVMPKELLKMVQTNHNSRLTRSGAMLSLTNISINFNCAAHLHRKTRD
jgi:hypothetical protein